MKWIPVKDRKPQLEPGPGSLCQNSGFVHVMRDGKRDIAVLFENGQWLDCNLNPIHNVTDWAEGAVQIGWYDVLDTDNDIPNPAASHD